MCQEMRKALQLFELRFRAAPEVAEHPRRELAATSSYRLKQLLWLLEKLRGRRCRRRKIIQPSEAIAPLLDKGAEEEVAWPRSS